MFGSCNICDKVYSTCCWRVSYSSDILATFYELSSDLSTFYPPILQNILPSSILQDLSYDLSYIILQDMYLSDSIDILSIFYEPSSDLSVFYRHSIDLVRIPATFNELSYELLRDKLGPLADLVDERLPHLDLVKRLPTLIVLHPIPITRLRYFRTQPLEHLSATVKLPIKKGFWATQPLEQIL